MNLEIANRLVKLRKDSGLSQEELADKLGISRQAVSKWERAEASPDTDNLICLAKLYGISLDELLNSNEDIKTIVEEQIKNDEQKIKDKNVIKVENGSIFISDDENEVNINFKGIHIKGKDGEEKCCSTESLCGKIASGITTLICVITFLILGFCTSWGWRQGWIIFLAIPIVESFVKAITTKRFSVFSYPVLVVMAYLIVGLNTSWGWHPGWIMFLTIPVFYSIFKPLDAYLDKKQGVKPTIE